MNKVKSSKKLPDVKIFETEIFNDFRGSYIESFNLEFFNQHSNVNFVQDDFSLSRRHQNDAMQFS